MTVASFLEPCDEDSQFVSMKAVSKAVSNKVIVSVNEN